MTPSELILKSRAIPVVKIDDAANAVPLARALAAGGVPIIEITFRTTAAPDAIRNVAREVPDVLVGAGTVLTVAQAKQALAAGAKFVVSPGLDPDVVRFCLKKRVMVLPGAVTPTEIQLAMKLGLSMVKFFPAEASGGVKMLKALSAPLPQMKFVPTGGVGKDNLKDYLALSCVAACGGTWLAEADWIKNADWAAVTVAARETVAIVNGK
jgi:2-dehydro-3-deoxyphosphogluconate aldolase/(4S)-4-hydroxy-2-oxoglutarate aldolase